MQDFLKKNNRALVAKTFLRDFFCWAEYYSAIMNEQTYAGASRGSNLFPPVLHLVPMDAQWMLNGC